MGSRFQPERQPGGFGFGGVQDTQKPLDIRPQCGFQSVGMAQDQGGILGQTGEAVRQGIEIAAVPVREGEGAGQSLMQDLTVRDRPSI